MLSECESGLAYRGRFGDADLPWRCHRSLLVWTFSSSLVAVITMHFGVMKTFGKTDDRHSLIFYAVAILVRYYS